MREYYFKTCVSLLALSYRLVGLSQTTRDSI